MRIGILGSGVVARTLAGGFLKHGHGVTVGTRDPGKLTDWGKQHPDARVGTGADAASAGEVLVLAVKGTAAFDALRLAGAANLNGKVVEWMEKVTDEQYTSQEANPCKAPRA